ncbi:hypothetical protein IPZ58_11200 [Streptomyces roseoverticillatus]|uniref:hypothetical protein n=1 Tax=Streptomyces roseoverticillatus TaxID=66429 RepID=UPI001F39CC2F|nr:hypothetical protein [Streptomyces roseoverticillatus]MCF3102151.1 hypothetical protein [Streptomyces roseoverticillatus]
MSSRLSRSTRSRRRAVGWRAFLSARFKRLPVIWKIVVVAALAVAGFYGGKVILASVLNLLLGAFAACALLFIPVFLIKGLGGGGGSKRRRVSHRESYERWCEENDGRGRYHSDSGVPF